MNIEARSRAADLLAITSAIPPRTRLILAAESLLDDFGTRTEDGHKLTAEWGEPSPEGWYSPTFHIHDDGMEVRPKASAIAAATAEFEFVALAARYRAEHEATHGEPEQCGGPCIVLGLTEFEAEADPIASAIAAATADLQYVQRVHDEAGGPDRWEAVSVHNPAIRVIGPTPDAAIAALVEAVKERDDG